MAAARKSRNVNIPVTEYTIALADVLAALLDPAEIKQGGWSLLVLGDTVSLTRVGGAVEVVDPKSEARADAVPLDSRELETP